MPQNSLTAGCGVPATTPEPEIMQQYAQGAKKKSPAKNPPKRKQFSRVMWRRRTCTELENQKKVSVSYIPAFPTMYCILPYHILLVCMFCVICMYNINVTDSLFDVRVQFFIIIFNYSRQAFRSHGKGLGGKMGKCCKCFSKCGSTSAAVIGGHCCTIPWTSCESPPAPVPQPMLAHKRTNENDGICLFLFLHIQSIQGKGQAQNLST